MTSTESPDPLFNEGVSPEQGMKVELYVNDKAQALVLHNMPFKKKLSWLEYDLTSSHLNFVLENGDIRNFGIPVHPNLARYLQNSFQILLVLVDEELGKQVNGDYYPLIIHRS
jgi:hypothetical protein